MVVKREHTRYVIKLPVELTAGDETIKGTTVRISEKGFFVRAQRSFRVGTPVDVTLQLTESSSCRMKGVVKYARNVTISMRQNGMGIELTEDVPQYLEFIRSFQ